MALLCWHDVKWRNRWRVVPGLLVGAGIKRLVPHLGRSGSASATGGGCDILPLSLFAFVYPLV